MTCCAPTADMVRAAARDEVRLASRDLGDGRHETELAVPTVHCAACIRTVEEGLMRLPAVDYARVNLSARRVTVRWRDAQAPDLLAELSALGFPAHLTTDDDSGPDPELGRLVRALAVAGFGAMNIMLLSVSVWSGADVGTRHAFHWISAAIALPCLLYSGRIFFASAWSALRLGRTNMDVPISIGISLAFGLSLYDTIHNGPHAYFDAAVSLVFFLLIGRTLDHVMRERVRTAVRGLVRLTPRGATLVRDDGDLAYLPVADIRPGMILALAAGDRVPVDAVVTEGVSDLDCAIVTGESAPQRAEAGFELRAGMLNLSAPLMVRAVARAEDSFLAEMVRLMSAAEDGRAHYRRIADRAAALYSPVVHTAAFLTLAGWLIGTGDWHRAITIAIAVLIITCPCALGLAVPIVQVVAARRLFERGVMVKNGSAFERMAEVDVAVFDKTGTLTFGRPRLTNRHEIAPEALAIAAALGRLSRHPFSQAVAAATPATPVNPADVSEHAGLGIEGRVDGHLYRLGRAEWALADGEAGMRTGTVLGREGRFLAGFAFEDALRPQARASVAALRDAGVDVMLLSGDGAGPVAATAAALGLAQATAGMMPAQKVERLKEIAAQGRKALMVGDGLNDVPALAAAHVSMAPASAADIGRNAADFVFLREGLDAVPLALAVSRDAKRLVRQNFGLAVAYNAIALPLAVAGYVTPLIAALAMSLSSVLVVANALRLGFAATAVKSANEDAAGISGGLTPAVAEHGR